MNPIENPDLKLAIVMLIVPFFVNVSAMLHFYPFAPCFPVFLFRVPSLTEKTPYSPQVPLCAHSPPPIATPDLEMAGLLPHQADPCSRPSTKDGGSWELCLALSPRNLLPRSPTPCVAATSRSALLGIHPSPSIPDCAAPRESHKHPV